MTPETCIAFFENCARDRNNVQSQANREKGIKEIFTNDLDNDGKLTKDDFLSFYHSRS
jgi:hypothetical protein